MEEILSTAPLTVKSAQKQKVLDSFEFLQYLVGVTLIIIPFYLQCTFKVEQRK